MADTMSREALEAAAKEIAEYANTCCYRGDGYEEDVAARVLAKLIAAQADAYERAAKVCDELYDSGGTAYGCADAIRALAKETK